MLIIYFIIIKYPDILSEKNIENFTNFMDHVRNTKIEYFNELMQEHDNDPQNVHDPGVISGLKKKFYKLHDMYKSDAEKSDLAICIDEIIEYISKKKNNENTRDIYKMKYALLSSIIQNNIITSFGEEVKEGYILLLIWLRIKSDDNKKNFDKLIDSLLYQLSDMCIEDENGELAVVCINGRVARMFSSLILLDNDPELAEPERDISELTNLAYSKASNILQSMLKDDEMNTLYMKEDDMLTEIEKQQITDFENKIKNKIEETLILEFKDLIPKDKLDNIISTSKKAI